MCASPDVATPPTIVTNHKKNIVNTENTQKDTDNIDIENGDNTRPSTTTKTNVSTTGGLGWLKLDETYVPNPFLMFKMARNDIKGTFKEHTKSIQSAKQQ